MKIGFFDSGSGGLTTLDQVRQLIPEAEYYYIGDIQHHPYGEKTEEELHEITKNVVQKLSDWGAKFVVIACNTATTRCIHYLRSCFPDITFVGMEPAIKVACDAGCQNILLLATPSTISSKQVERLINQNIHTQNIFLVPCPGLANLIEQNVPDIEEMKLWPGQIQPGLETANTKSIQRALLNCLSNVKDLEKIDGVVLGCTHYILARDVIQEILPNAKIFDGNLGVAKRVKNLLSN